MDGHIVGSMISANSITGEQIQANSIKTANLELSVQKKIQDATNEETVKALIKADLDGFESTLSKEFVTVENATTQIQQATEVAVKEATQSIIDNAVTESMGAVDGQLNDKLNQYTGNTLLPAIAEKAEEVLQNAEDYVVTKLESYATKQELSSSISQTREQIELSVSEKYTTKTESATIITEAIDGITVGAINRALGTGENKSFKFNGGANETWLPYKFSNDISDKEAYVSFNYTLTGTAQNGSQIEFAPSYLKKTNNQTVYRPKHVFFTSNRLQDVNITDTVSFTTKDFQDISPSSTSYIRFVGNGFTGTLSISEVQIKPGNSKTSWSPAPEDVDNDIVNAKNEAIISANNTLISTIANHYTKSETDSKISVAKNEINLGVSNTYETKTNVETKVASTLNSAKSYSDTKKTEAINAASTDATNKVNSAKTELNTAIGKKANSVDVYTKSEVYTKAQTDSAIKVAKDEINLGVSSTYETKANVETKVSSTLNSAKSYADTKKTEAINSAASDATSKVNAAKSELNTAIGKKANTVDVYSKAEVYTKSQTDSAIKVAKDEINLGVSNTYETKANVETKINGVAIGGTNLLLNSHFDYDRNWAKGTGVTRVQEGFDGGYCMKTVGAFKETRNFSQGVSITKLEKGQQYTATVWLKTQNVVRGTTNPHLYLYANYSLNNKWVTECALSKAIPNGTTAWTKYVLTFTIPTVDFDVMTVDGYARDFTGIIWWDGIKLEKGNKASDWSPSPLDISTDITNAKTEAINTASSDATNKANNAKNEAINSANNTLTTTIANYYTKSQTDSQINVAKNAITSSVSSTYATKTDVTSSINGVNSSISNLQNRMNSAEQKITDTAITNTVKKNFYTKEETNNQITSKGYQTASQVQQTVDALQLKFTQSGGYNKVRRSKPNETSNSYGFATRPIDGTDLKHDKVYTLTVNGRTVNGTGGKHLVVFIYDNGWNFSKSISIAETVDTTKSISFTIPNTVNLNNLQVTSYHYPSGGDRTGSSKVNWYQLTEGSLELPWSPHPSEVYDGITTIDKDGVTVTSSNVNSKTKMSADGFQLIRTTDNKKMFYVNQDGSLEMSGNFTQYDSNGKISIKVANNSYGCYDWLWDGDFVGNFGAFESNRKNTSGANQRFIGISNIADYGNQLILGVRSSPNSTNFNSYIEIDNTTLMHRDYVTFTANTGFKTNAIFRNPSNNNNETGRIFGATNNHFFVACNYNNQLRLGYEKNGSYYPGISIYRNDNTSAGCAIEYYADEVHHNNVVIDGFLSVKGQKNRLVATENFGDRLLNAYETAECYFGDINEAIIGEDGEVKVELDEVFLATVNTTETYHVFLTKYGEGDCYVSERHEKYFVIKGTPNLSVGFEIKAKQRGYEKERLKMAVDTSKSHQATSSEDEAGYTIDCETTTNRA